MKVFVLLNTQKNLYIVQRGRQKLIPVFEDEEDAQRHANNIRQLGKVPLFVEAIEPAVIQSFCEKYSYTFQNVPKGYWQDSYRHLPTELLGIWQREFYSEGAVEN